MESRLALKFALIGNYGFTESVLTDRRSSSKQLKKKAQVRSRKAAVTLSTFSAETLAAVSATRPVSATPPKIIAPRKRSALKLTLSEKRQAASARYGELVFSLADSLLCDTSLARQTVDDVFAALSKSSEIFAASPIDSEEFEREIHRVTYDIALARLLQKSHKPTAQ